MKKIYLPLLLAVICMSISCKNDSNYSNQDSNKDSEIVNNNINTMDGEQLSRIYCGSCHEYPEPQLLDVDTWKNYMLPRMGYMYGIYKTSEEHEALFENNEGGEIVRASGLFPSTRTLDSLSWNKIQNYYLNNAPRRLEVPPKKEITKQLSQFTTIIPDQKVQIPSSTMAQFSDSGQIYLGDAVTRSFSIFSSQLELLNTGNVQEGAVSIFDGEDAFWLTVMGSFSPTDEPRGLIATLPKSPSVKSTVPIKRLQRPVHSDYGDLNGDGFMDIVVSEFGKWTGALSVFINNQGNYTKNVLLATPGAIKSYMRDMNNDGHLDIVALFAQGAEGVDIYYNDGKANFTRSRVLKFSPSMGGSFMNLIDYNDDGHLDILFTAGDNADYKPVMKPWHGIYVFLNDGNNNFNQELFIHHNGAYNAVVEDFDGDGDKDVAAISFFPDWVNTPEESFVYYKNKGDSTFEHFTFQEVNKGRWVVMHASDYDKDGDIDLILGSLAFEVVPKLGYVEQWMKEGIPFVILQNNKF
ncbi:VCBS repeat-containing protein [Winogradskyella sp.]|uniref:FG-GAP repeat domain-containing protein n=1 Tax=Winogradskyella sp. TaxID=1883156 RepID=UPI00260ACC3C|nr:VCBS repeat-containing protein [Winogradskyella sp.]